MPAAYVQRQFADGLKGGLALRYADLTRAFRFGTRWRKIRIGINIALNEAGRAINQSGAVLAMGLSSGPTGYYSSTNSTPNWLGYMPFSADRPWNYTSSITYNAGGGNPYFSESTRGVYWSKVNQTTTVFTNSAGGQANIPTVAGTLKRRGPMILEVTKSAGLLTLHSEVTNATCAVLNCSTTDFNDIVDSTVALTPATYSAVVQSSSVSITATSEINGIFDSFNLTWGCAGMELEVYEATVARIS